MNLIMNKLKLMILAFCMLFTIGCAFNPNDYTVNNIENIKDEQSKEILYSYFSKQERDYICSHLIQINSRNVLGKTRIYEKNNFILSDVTLYDDVIKEMADEYALPFEFFRGLTIIHELCHVLHPEDDHNSIWLNDFKSKIVDYCWGEFEHGNLDDVIDDYQNIETLIKYIVFIKTYEYEK